MSGGEGDVAESTRPARWSTPDAADCDHQEFDALTRHVLVALGLGPDRRKEIVGFRLATAASAVQWEAFLGDRGRRGLTGERPEMLGNEQDPRAFTFCGYADSAGAREVAQGS